MDDNSRSSTRHINIYPETINPEISREYPRIDSTYGFPQNIEHLLKDKDGSIDLYPIDYCKYLIYISLFS